MTSTSLAQPESTRPTASSPVPGPPPEAGVPSVGGRPRVIAAAVERSRRHGVIRKLNRVVENGGTALMITADGSERPEELHPAVQVLDLRAGERRLGLNALITRDPARLVRRARGRAISGPSPAWAWLSASKPYRMIRPWLLWRVLRRRLEVLRVAEVDHVIIVHQNSWPIAWQLHKLNPAISISYEVPDSAWTANGRTPPSHEPDDPTPST
jgi:hypothetical protein